MPPGIIIGHGFGVAPTLFALNVQPSIFTFASMLVVWIIALSVIFGVPALRNDQSEWPPSAASVFLRAHMIKFVFFGVIAATLMQAISFSDHRSEVWLAVLMYGLFFAGATVNLVLCYWATRSRQANPMATPVLFAAPALLVAAPTVALFWYGGGAMGGLMRRRHSPS